MMYLILLEREYYDCYKSVETEICGVTTSKETTNNIVNSTMEKILYSLKNYKKEDFKNVEINDYENDIAVIEKYCMSIPSTKSTPEIDITIIVRQIITDTILF